jgi:hypothetical protein
MNILSLFTEFAHDIVHKAKQPLTASNNQYDAHEYGTCFRIFHTRQALLISHRARQHTEYYERDTFRGSSPAIPLIFFVFALTYHHLSFFVHIP